jgi:integrase
MARKRRRPWGQGSVKRRGNWWWIRWREGGKRKSARFPREDQAEETLAKILAEIALGQRGVNMAAAPEPDTSTIAELAEDWLQRREGTHRAAGDDRSRFAVHLLPYFGKMRPAEVTSAVIRAFIEDRLRTKSLRGSGDDRTTLSSTSVGHLVRTLSTFFSDLVERGLVPANPCRGLPRSTRRLIRNAHDPKDSPFLRTKDEIRAVYLALPEPYNVMFAVGALAGLRTGEVIGLDWRDVDLLTQRIHIRRQVQDGKLTPLKDSESRIAPILDSLLPILEQWRLRTGGAGLMFRPKHPTRGGRPDLEKPSSYIRQHTLNTRLQAVLRKLGLAAAKDDASAGAPALNWYRCTRHTFASHWVLDGRSMERLRLILGHEDLSTTMRYAHLAPGSFTAADLAAVAVDLSAPTGKVLPLRAEIGSEMGSGEVADEQRAAK